METVPLSRGGRTIRRRFILRAAFPGSIGAVVRTEGFALHHGDALVRLGGAHVNTAVLHQIAVYATTYMSIFAVASVVMVGMGLDLTSAMTSVIACLSSVGPGLGQVGPSQTYEFIPVAGKLVLILCMIAGRLEIFALLAVFTPECWRR